MGFVTLRPRARTAMDDDEGDPLDVLITKLTEDSHTINGVEVELTEALDKPKKEDEDSEKAAGETPSLEASATPAATQDAPAKTAAQIAADDAKFRMHYLALAMGASVPAIADMPKGPPPVAKGAGKDKGKGKGFGKPMGAASKAA